ncbi:uncharacterized protein LOC119185819 isoform X15 [Rhipicephalus microplus]|uniref:uncharacterized protein LOC119185819 isoform X15 n=1 Tax=Rhipicephalus microplus TaxID=6941 RepID=UPI003F6CB654
MCHVLLRCCEYCCWMKKTRSKDVFSGLQASWLVGQKTVHASACSRARQPRACQQEDGMDAHLEVVGVGPRDSVNRLGDFAFEPCIYFFWALLCLLAKAVNAKHLHLEAPCVLSLSEPSPMSSREGSCVPTTPVRSSSPREVRLRSSTLSTPETPKRSPLVNIFRKMKHTRCSSSSDEEPPEAATEETLCRQSVFQRVNSPLRGRNNNTGSRKVATHPWPCCFSDAARTSLSVAQGHTGAGAAYPHGEGGEAASREPG